ncbi:TetR/AcrR family transcriptional regulator [Saccharomonospora piscinae]|uniref:TetR/AcrR family transcriptional regulator n=1 Tax=Saccharomonospora piscinae TaxID=687388 RepID=UPI0004672C83|nr:TetR/AcrR family transcriptional regulator [Saccharomonospora piscinae]
MSTTPRRDAARNRDRLITAARHCFATLGPDAPLEDIARAAGVSRTTLHRHFEAREDLAAAVLEQNVSDIESRARKLLDVADGLERLFHYLLDVQAEAPWLARFVSADAVPPETRTLGDRTAAAIEALVDQARARGVLWPELGTEDVLLALPMAMAAQMARQHPASTHRSDHVRTVLHRGLFTTDPPRRRSDETKKQDG